MAGSAKGERRGGRKAGTPNKKTGELLERIMASGLTPLEFLIDAMRGETRDKDGLPMVDASGAPIVLSFETRFEAAKAAAPYIHAKRTQVEGTGSGGAIIVHISKDDADL